MTARGRCPTRSDARLPLDPPGSCWRPSILARWCLQSSDSSDGVPAARCDHRSRGSKRAVRRGVSAQPNRCFLPRSTFATAGCCLASDTISRPGGSPAVGCRSGRERSLDYWLQWGRMTTTSRAEFFLCRNISSPRYLHTRTIATPSVSSGPARTWRRCARPPPITASPVGIVMIWHFRP